MAIAVIVDAVALIGVDAGVYARVGIIAVAFLYAPAVTVVIGVGFTNSRVFHAF